MMFQKDFHIHIHIDGFDRVAEVLAQLLKQQIQVSQQLQTLTGKVVKMANEFDELNSSWEQFKTAMNTEIEQINSKVQSLVDALNNSAPPTELKRIAGEIQEATARISNIVPDAPPVEEEGEGEDTEEEGGV